MPIVNNSLKEAQQILKEKRFSCVFNNFNGLLAYFFPLFFIFRTLGLLFFFLRTLEFKPILF